ncbi:hypothetical protein IEQ34_014855 [Dendrobium chrysotoxum]|uniref:Uncharacterized protein n=1 Tax=Dendrobium chrysotoxum TaxID=161865 RepID=A0AAV7GN47_DENCH|nr:hypothetical protein IEQ34_014855 [Dendrobium chrysotoxum]
MALTIQFGCEVTRVGHVLALTKWSSPSWRFLVAHRNRGANLPFDIDNQEEALSILLAILCIIHSLGGLQLYKMQIMAFLCKIY